MNIAILTLFHGNYNWGGVLQGYALKYLLEEKISKDLKMNVNVDIVNYKSKYNPIYPTVISQMTQYTFFEVYDKVVEKICWRNDADLENKLFSRKELFDKFTSKLTTVPGVVDDNELFKLSENYDYVISGSDQVWNPNVARLGYFQRNVSPKCVKVSYAASIAREKLSKREKNFMQPCLEGFDYISVREQTAKKLVEGMLCGKKVYEVLDPSLLLAKEDWDEISSPERVVPRKYVLCFFFSNSEEYRKKISNICQVHEYELVFIALSKNVYFKSDERGEGYRLYDIGPKEFLNLFKHAEYVFTDSFHGSVFSLIYKKDFLVFERDRNTKVSKNSRLYDLLDKFDISERLVYDLNDIEVKYSQEINYEYVDKIIEKNRSYSIDFLLSVFSFE